MSPLFLSDLYLFCFRPRWPTRRRELDLSSRLVATLEELQRRDAGAAKAAVAAGAPEADHLQTIAQLRGELAQAESARVAVAGAPAALEALRVQLEAAVKRENDAVTRAQTLEKQLGGTSFAALCW